MTKKEQAKLYTVISVDSAAWGFSPAGSDVLSADVISTKVLSDLIHSWAMEHAPMLPPVVARGQQSPKHDIACMDLERKQRIARTSSSSECCFRSKKCHHLRTPWHAAQGSKPSPASQEGHTSSKRLHHSLGREQLWSWLHQRSQHTPAKLHSF